MSATQVSPVFPITVSVQWHEVNTDSDKRLIPVLSFDSPDIAESLGHFSSLDTYEASVFHERVTRILNGSRAIDEALWEVAKPLLDGKTTARPSVGQGDIVGGGSLLAFQEIYREALKEACDDRKHDTFVPLHYDEPAEFNPSKEQQAPPLVDGVTPMRFLTYSVSADDVLKPGDVFLKTVWIEKTVNPASKSSVSDVASTKLKPLTIRLRPSVTIDSVGDSTDFQLKIDTNHSFDQLVQTRSIVHILTPVEVLWRAMQPVLSERSRMSAGERDTERDTQTERRDFITFLKASISSLEADAMRKGHGHVPKMYVQDDRDDDDDDDEWGQSASAAVTAAADRVSKTETETEYVSQWWKGKADQLEFDW